MGEVLFKYWPGRIPQYQMAFRYWYDRTNEYRFAYHRYVTSVDASKLKGPVAITKVASGFRCIEDCFWAYESKEIHDINNQIEELGIKTNHLGEFGIPRLTDRYKNLAIMRGNASIYLSKNINILMDIFISKNIEMSIYQTATFSSIYNKAAFGNKMESVISDSKKVNDKGYISIEPESGRALDENRQVIACKSFPEVTIYGQIMADKIWSEFNIYTHLIAKKIRPVSENLFEFVSGGETWKLMDIYSYMYSALSDKLLNRIPNVMAGKDTLQIDRFKSSVMAKRAVNIMNLLENIYAEKTSGGNLMKLEWLCNCGITEPEIEWKIFEQIMVSMDTYEINRYENILAELPDRILNHIAQLFGWRNDPQVIRYKNENAEPVNDIVIGMHGDINGWQNNPQVNWIAQIYGEKPHPETNIFDIYLACKPDKRLPVYLPSINILPAYKNTPISNILQGVNSHAFKDFKDIISNIGYSVKKPVNTDTVLNMDTFVVHDAKYTVVFDELHVHGEKQFVDDLSLTPIFGYKTKNSDGGGSLFHQTHLSKGIKKVSDMYKVESAYGIPQNVMFGHSAVLDISGKITIIQYIYPSLKKKNRKVGTKRGVWVNDTINNQLVSVHEGEFIKRPIRELSDISVELLWGNKNKKSIRIDRENEWVSKYKRPLNNTETGLDVARSCYQLFGPISEDRWESKSSYSVWNEDKKEEFLQKIKHSMWSEEQTVNMYRIPYDIDSIPVNAFLQKIKYELDLIKKTTDFLYRKPYVLSRFDQPDFLHKLMKPVQTVENIESLWRTSYNLNLFLGIDSEDTVFIPITKTRHNAFIDRVNEMLYRYPYLAENIINDSFLSPIPHDTWMEYDPLFSFKEPYPAMIEYENEMIFKLNVKTVMQRKEWSCDKLPKHIFIDTEDEWTSKAAIHLGIFHSEEWVEKVYKPLWMFDPIDSIYKGPDHLSIYADEWINETPRLLYYTYGVFAEHFPEDLNIFNEIPETGKQKRDLNMFSSELWSDRKWRDIFIEDVAFTGKTMYESNLFQEALNIHRICKEIEEFTNNFSNWAWVYEIPDPIEPVFGIDELLLPENDTRYSDFEELIFNPKTMRPRNPVKQIDSTTFIAKYPTKHPFPERADVGRYYDDSAIKFENYYGIESEIMYLVYLQFFKIWQAKIFEFGGMDMVNATKKMLEYIYTWIIGGGLPLEKVEQGLRVYRQIRWYAESAVIRNSQYVVTYELDNLHSNLHTGKCDIPNDLHPGGTMFIDQNLAVIRCAPDTINNGPASVTFFLDTYRNSIMTFSLLNTVGSVNIYVDGILVDTRSVSGRVSVDLIYTGDTIEVKIEKDAANNRNKYFYIGDITVPDMSYKDLKVSFDPTLKMGNKPLDEVMRKMIQYANLYDDINEAYDRVRKGNLGVNETYRLMLQYWELHHKNKIKGKRLTIKET